MKLDEDEVYNNPWVLVLVLGSWFCSWGPCPAPGVLVLFLGSWSCLWSLSWSWGADPCPGPDRGPGPGVLVLGFWSLSWSWGSDLCHGPGSGPCPGPGSNLDADFAHFLVLHRRISELNAANAAF
uniref:Uncharacterized protein n=1 Tax=Glossina brevipalpis TaxID=37001 RepID=A0A1A9W9B1_9MUSC